VLIHYGHGVKVKNFSASARIRIR